MHVHVQPPVKWKASCLMVIGVLLKQELENLYTWRERAREGGREREERGEMGEGGWEDPYEFVTRCFSQILTKFPRALFNVGITAVRFALPAQIWK